MHLTSSVVNQLVTNFKLYCCSKKFQMLQKNVKSLLEQLKVCIFAEIVFGVRCTLISRGSSQGRGAQPLHPPPRSAPGEVKLRFQISSAQSGRGLRLLDLLSANQRGIFFVVAIASCRLARAPTCQFVRDSCQSAPNTNFFLLLFTKALLWRNLAEKVFDQVTEKIDQVIDEA